MRDDLCVSGNGFLHLAVDALMKSWLFIYLLQCTSLSGCLQKKHLIECHDTKILYIKNVI